MEKLNALPPQGSVALKASAFIRVVLCISLIVGLLSFRNIETAQTIVRPSFEVATVKPLEIIPGQVLRYPQPCHGIDSDPRAALPPIGRCKIQPVTARKLISLAYSPIKVAQELHSSGGPAWVDSQAWAIEGKAESRSATLADLQQMLQSLLADSFKLKFHEDQRKGTEYVLMLSEKGTRLVPDNPEVPATMRSTGPGSYELHAQPIGILCRMIAKAVGAEVHDETGLPGIYSFNVALGRDVDSSSAGQAERFSETLRGLGLRLARRDGIARSLVIDSIEKPPLQ